VRESPAFDPNKAMPDAEVIAAAYPVALRFAPGTRWEYSNVGYYTLAENHPRRLWTAVGRVHRRACVHTACHAYQRTDERPTATVDGSRLWRARQRQSRG